MFFLCVFITQQPLRAQLLTSGDLVIIGYNFSDPDDFSVLTLVDLPAGLQFYITDAGWDDQAKSFRKGEGLITYTVPAGGIKAGSQLLYPYDPGFVTQGMSGFFGLALAGDQLFIFQGSVHHPEFIFGLTDYNGTWQNSTTVVDNQNSHLPLSLQPGYTALALNHYVQAHFECMHHFEDKQQLLAQLSNPVYWIKTPVRISLPLSACDFSTLAWHEEQWSYEWKSPQCLDLIMFNAISKRASWWIHQGGKAIRLNCISDGYRRYSCLVPEDLSGAILLKPCFAASSEYFCGSYRFIEKEERESDLHLLTIKEGAIQVSWLELADEVLYHVYDLSGKLVVSGEAVEVNSFCIENLMPGCYVLTITKDHRLSRMKVCAIQ